MAVATRADPEVEQAKLEIAQRTQQAEALIGGDPNVLAVVTYLVMHSNETVTEIAIQTRIGGDTVGPALRSLIVGGVVQEFGGKSQIPTGRYGLTFWGVPFVRNRLPRWRREFEAALSRQSLDERSEEELIRSLTLLRMEMALTNRGRKFQAPLEKRVREIQDVLKKRQEKKS